MVWVRLSFLKVALPLSPRVKESEDVLSEKIERSCPSVLMPAPWGCVVSPTRVLVTLVDARGVLYRVAQETKTIKVMIPRASRLLVESLRLSICLDNAVGQEPSVTYTLRSGMPQLQPHKDS